MSGGEIMAIEETSGIVLRVDGIVVDSTFHDSNDAWQKAMNKLMAGARKAEIVETVNITRV